MKHILSTITVLFILLSSSVSLGNNFVCVYTGLICPEIDDFEKLIEVDGLLYKKFTEIPFTGHVTDGKLQGFVKDGKRDGAWVEFYNNGILRTKHNYKDGRMWDGLWEYYLDGELSQKEHYKDDVRVSD